MLIKEQHLQCKTFHAYFSPPISNMNIEINCTGWITSKFHEWYSEHPLPLTRTKIWLCLIQVEGQIVSKYLLTIHWRNSAACEWFRVKLLGMIDLHIVLEMPSCALNFIRFLELRKVQITLITPISLDFKIKLVATLLK